MQTNKELKIWGISYGIVGDLIMCLPVLTYFEKKYPNSYKYFVIQQKCSQAAPLFINHPLIDRIKITDGWNHFGNNDIDIYHSCDIKCPRDQHHDDPKWYNKRTQVEETARMAGIENLTEVLSKDELYPQLDKWFSTGSQNPVNNSYSKEYSETHLEYAKNTIAIWPFANYNRAPNRSPSKIWWKELIINLLDLGYNIHHYGYINEPTLSKHINYKKFTHLHYFNQVTHSLASKLVIGTDSGSMWTMGAYSHPSINLITNWLPGHNNNLLALAPVNKNGINLFAEGGCDNISIQSVLENL